MIRHLFFLLLLFSFEAVADEVQDLHSVFNGISSGALKIQKVEIANTNPFVIDEDNDRTIELPTDCKNFDLSKNEVIEFFHNARIMNKDDEKRYRRDGESLCGIMGNFELQDGRKIDWVINKTRNGYLITKLKTVWPDPKNSIFLYCEKCQNKQFYPLKGKGSFSGFRPVLKSVKINKSGMPSGFYGEEPTNDAYKYCKNYKLSKSDVIEFFKIARVATGTEVSQSALTLGRRACFAEGTAILNNGGKTVWYIGSDRYGSIKFEDEASDVKKFYYCHECNPKIFEMDCDHACEMDGSN